MASSHQSNEENSSDSESSLSYVSDSDHQSDVDLESDNEVFGSQPCKYYNSGGCKNGQNCTYLHTCKYFLKGNCRYGSRCKRSHSVSEVASPGASSRAPDQSRESNPKLTDGRYYQWQLNDGKGWKDIENDHIIEAQYSLPHTKSMKIYNTEHGAVSIDFSRITVYRKRRLKVRRLDDGNTEWIWYCTLRRKWIKYGDKDLKGNASPVKSSDIERKYQSDPTSSFIFSAGGETFEIKFTAMQQVGKKKRRVTRRPLYRQQQAGTGAVQAASALQRVSLGSKPQWQFEGNRGAWYEFKHRSGTPTECSITSDDIERKYQQNPRDTMTFKVNGNSYTLDLGGRIQTNLKNKHTSRIRRVLV
ncbi:zinc finger CCCH-type antiviral protein 1 [Odontesthes bonariensis]|uniref:zinc finger CCCH-type antiviral protein 1 n=1 Tax=Odontesthes bonariensis TaxID=219752 RepID=UPI003F5901CA